MGPKQDRVLLGLSFYTAIIIDDLMFMAMDRNEANMFFQLINRLYGQTSLIITSNKGPEDWGELLGEPTITTAILDRRRKTVLLLAKRGF